MIENAIGPEKILKRRSVRLEKSEHEKLKRVIKKFHTKTEMGEAFGLEINTVLRVEAFGSGSGKTVLALREILQKY